jgi:hypothetical protein
LARRERAAFEEKVGHGPDHSGRRTCPIGWLHAAAARLHWNHVRSRRRAPRRVLTRRRVGRRCRRAGRRPHPSQTGRWLGRGVHTGRPPPDQRSRCRQRRALEGGVRRRRDARRRSRRPRSRYRFGGAACQQQRLAALDHARRFTHASRGTNRDCHRQPIRISTFRVGRYRQRAGTIAARPFGPADGRHHPDRRGAEPWKLRRTACLQATRRFMSPRN